MTLTRSSKLYQRSFLYRATKCLNARALAPDAREGCLEEGSGFKNCAKGRGLIAVAEPVTSGPTREGLPKTQPRG